MLQIADFIAYFLRNYISTPFENNLFDKGADKRKVELLTSLKRIIDRKLIIKSCI
jgi:phosphatidate phosphatase APP1